MSIPTYAPTLYGLGDRMETWAAGALAEVREERIIVVGCSIGGSCALEIAAATPERVAALVLIGTKARRRPDPEMHAAAVEIVERHGLDIAWQVYWEPLFSSATPAGTIEAARQTMLRCSPADIIRGVDVFHTRPSCDACLSDFDGPIAVVTGAQDTAPRPATSEMQARSARRGTLHLLEDCGHYTMFRSNSPSVCLRSSGASCRRQSDARGFLKPGTSGMEKTKAGHSYGPAFRCCVSAYENRPAACASIV